MSVAEESVRIKQANDSLSAKNAELVQNLAHVEAERNRLSAAMKSLCPDDVKADSLINLLKDTLPELRAETLALVVQLYWFARLSRNTPNKIKAAFTKFDETLYELFSEEQELLQSIRQSIQSFVNTEVFKGTSYEVSWPLLNSSASEHEDHYNRENDEGNRICKVRSAVIINAGSVESVARAAQDDLRNAELFKEKRHEKHERQDHERHGAERAKQIRVADDIGEVIGLYADVLQNVEADDHPGIAPDISVLRENVPDILERDLHMLLTGVDLGILLHEEEATQRDHTEGKRVNTDQLAPAGSAGGDASHQHGEGHGNDHRAERSNKAAVRTDLADQGPVIIESTDQISRAARAAQGIEHTEDESIHEEYPHDLQRIAGARRRSEHQPGADPHSDDAQLIGTTFAPFGMGIVNNVARDQVGDRVDDIADQKDHTDDCALQPKIIGAIDGKIGRNDDVQSCG